MTIPYTFAGATTAIPLAQLDANFASPITLGNVAMTLSNTYTSIGNLTLTNVTVSSGNVAVTNLSYTGTLTGGTGVVNLGSGQFYKDTSGNVGIGTNSPNKTGFAAPVLSVSNGTAGIVELIGNQTSDGTVGQVAWYNNSATSPDRIAQILGLRSGANNSGALTFQTNNAGAGVAERMRITPDGYVLVGTTTTTGLLCGDVGSFTFTNGTAGAFLNWRAATGRPCIQVQSIQSGQDVAFRTASYDGTTSYYWTFGQNIASATGNLDFMYYSVAGAQTTSSGTTQVRFTNSGQIYNTSGTYGTISDAKLKENIVDATPKLDDLMQLKVRNFTLKADETKTKQLGFIAQEIQQVFPACVESFDDLDQETKEKTGETLTVKTAILIPMLVKAIQELNAKVDAQALEIATLKAK